MIDALIAGRLYGAPKQGTGKTGNAYTTAKVKAAAGKGETLLCSVICFDDKAQAARWRWVRRLASCICA